MAGGIYQNSVYGMAAKLPIKYTGAVVLGSNISGSFAAIMSLISNTFAESVRTAAIYYFITAMFVLLICFDTYFALPLNVSLIGFPDEILQDFKHFILIPLEILQVS